MTAAVQANRAAVFGCKSVRATWRLLRRIVAIAVGSAAAVCAQGAAVNPPSLAVGFADLSDSIKALAKEVSADAADVAFPALQQAHLIVENLELDLEPDLGKPFSRLKEKQRSDYHQAVAIVDRIGQTPRDRQGWIAVSKHVDAVAAQLLRDVGPPAVLSYRPASMVPGGEGAVTVEIVGVGLQKGEAVADFGGVAILPSADDKDRLQIQLPAAQIQGAEKAVSTASVQLNLSRTKKPLLITDFLGGTKTASFELLLFVLPKTLGTYRVSALVPGAAVETREMQTDPITVESESAIGRTETCRKLVIDEPGWDVDPESVRWQSTLEENGQFVRVQKAQDGGVCLLFTVYGRGVALGPGRIRGYAAYSASRQAKDPKPEQIAAGSLEWGQEAAAPLPAGVEEYVVEATLFDGAKLTVEEPGQYGLVEIREDEPGRRLLIRSRKPQL